MKVWGEKNSVKNNEDKSASSLKFHVLKRRRQEKKTSIIFHFDWCFALLTPFFPEMQDLEKQQHHMQNLKESAWTYCKYSRVSQQLKGGGWQAVQANIMTYPQFLSQFSVALFWQVAGWAFSNQNTRTCWDLWFCLHQKGTWFLPLTDSKLKKPLKYWKAPFEMTLTTPVSGSSGPGFVLVLCWAQEDLLPLKSVEMGNTESFT